MEGASVAAKFFQDEGIHFAFILDEGLALNQGSVPGISQGTGQNQYNQVVIASVGVAEKGWVNVQLSQGIANHVILISSRWYLGTRVHAKAVNQFDFFAFQSNHSSSG